MLRDILLKKRRDKATAHLEQFAPVWLVSDVILDADESIVFNVVFVHPEYGWVNRRYKYDGFNDVLYYLGQVTVDETVALQVQDSAPFIENIQSRIPDSYGG